MTIETIRFDVTAFKEAGTKQKRNKTIATSVTSAEPADIKKMAELLDLKLGEYLRVLHLCVKSAYKKGDLK